MIGEQGSPSPKSITAHLMCYAENSSIHGRISVMNSSDDISMFLGIQYLIKRSCVTRLIWVFLVLFSLAGATIFASNVFIDWQGEHTITSLKTISKPVNELDFPSVTICKDGQNMQAVMEALERVKDEWAGIIRKKRASGQEGFNDYQLLFAFCVRLQAQRYHDYEINRLCGN